MFSPQRNLLKTQNIPSISKGLKIARTATASIKLLAFKKDPNNIAPKKVLPTSPIKTFAGNQLKIKKAKREKTNIRYNFEKRRDKNKNVNTNAPQTRPSSPSIKLIILIKAVPTIIKNKVKKILFPSLKFNLSQYCKIVIEVRS